MVSGEISGGENLIRDIVFLQPVVDAYGELMSDLVNKSEFNYLRYTLIGSAKVINLRQNGLFENNSSLTSSIGVCGVVRYSFELKPTENQTSVFEFFKLFGFCFRFGFSLVLVFSI